MVSIQPWLLVAQLGTFLVAMSIVWMVGWKPIVKMMVARRDTIRSSLDQAEQNRLAASKLEEEYRHRLAQLEEKSSELIRVSTMQASFAREEAIKAAQHEVDLLWKKTREELDQERVRMMEQLRPEIVRIALLITQKAIPQLVEKTNIGQDRFMQLLDSIDSKSSATAQAEAAS